MKSLFKNIITFILRIESRLVLFKYKPKVIAITGSVGKTSTKDAVYAVLSGISYVRKSEKSYNSEIGLPLTILGCPNGWNNPLIWFLNILKGFWLFVWPHKYPKWLILEVGIGKPGDMARTASWLKTDAVIITAIGDTPVHIEFFDSHKHLIEEKAKLIKTLKKDGLLVLNNDDESVAKMRTRTKNRTITFGFKENSDIKASNNSIFYNEKEIPEGLTFRIDEAGSSLPVIVEGVFDKSHVYSSLGALALSSGLKLNMIDAISKLKNYSILPGRMRLLSGINNSLIIDDTYNSSPIACQLALSTLKEIKSNGRKVAILADMLELGRHTDEAHKNIGEIAQDNLREEDVLIVAGLRAKKIKEGALDRGMRQENIFEFLNAEETGKFLETFVQKGDLILIKGSQGMRMERAIEYILWDKEKNIRTDSDMKSGLLVRQDKEWLRKK